MKILNSQCKLFKKQFFWIAFCILFTSLSALAGEIRIKEGKTNLKIT